MFSLVFLSLTPVSRAIHTNDKNSVIVPNSEIWGSAIQVYHGKSFRSLFNKSAAGRFFKIAESVIIKEFCDFFGQFACQLLADGVLLFQLHDMSAGKAGGDRGPR